MSRLLPILATLALAAAVPAAEGKQGPPPGKGGHAGAPAAPGHGGKGKGGKPGRRVKPVKLTPATRMPMVGIADQKVDMFADARFHLLGLRAVRLAVSWDAMKHPDQVRFLDAYLGRAKAAGADPLVTFTSSKMSPRLRTWPTPAQFVAQFKRFRARYPQVRTFSTWNEANLGRLWRDPARVAHWWLALSAACRTCTVLGADLVDSTPMPGSTRADDYARAFVKAAHREPRVWGFHNYTSVNRKQSSSTVAMLKAVRGDVWLTETGGVVRRSKALSKFPEGVTHAASVTKFILTRVAALSNRVKRVYLYQWNASTSGDTWDSGFVGPDGTARPALGVLAKLLAP